MKEPRHLPAAPEVYPGGVEPIEQARLLRSFTVLLVAWVAISTTASLAVPGDPRDAWFDLMIVAPIVVLPGAWVVAYRRSPRLRATMLSLDFSAITAVQGMRIAGIAMLSLWAADVMTPGFALWAGDPRRGDCYGYGTASVCSIS